MLFTDSDAVTQAQLAQIDPEVSKLLVNNVALPIAPLITNAINEAGTFILSRMQNFTGYLVGFGQNANHAAAVLNIGNTSVSRPRLALSQVVVIDPNPAKTYMLLWLQMWAMRQIYRAAALRASGKETDRMETKRDNYVKEVDRIWKSCERLGIPVVLTPLACPGATRQYGAGTWPNTNSVTAGGTGSTDPGNPYSVAITWCALPGYQGPNTSNNSESALSATASVETLSSQIITVSTLGANAPGSYNAQIGTSDAFYTSMIATHWNVYVGTPAGPMYLQNATPIPLSTRSYTLPNQPVNNTAMAGSGQFSDYNFAFSNVIQRM